MKRTLLLFIYVIINSDARSQSPNEYTINAKLTGLKDNTHIYLIHYTNGMNDTVAKDISHNGIFRFKGVVKVASEFYRILIGNESNSIPILLENANLTIRASISDNWTDNSIFNIKMSGSKSQDDFTDYKRVVYELVKERDELKEKRNIAMTTNETLAIRIGDSVVKIRNKIENIRKGWVNEHSNSLYSPYLIANSNSSLSEQEIEFDKLTMRSKSSFYGIRLKEEIERMRIMATILVGNIGPNFISNASDGRPLSLRDVASVSTLTLIDFWASWCIPCREETPNLRKVYDAFHKKGFNIISVSFDNKEESWKDAIAKDSMSWIQVSQLKGREEEAGLLYGINGIPASILLDSLGRIIAIDAAGAKINSAGGSLRGDALYKKIETILSDK